jgi:hypothetical protein
MVSCADTLLVKRRGMVSDSAHSARKVGVKGDGSSGTHTHMFICAIMSVAAGVSYSHR